ncbi:MAG: flagellar basal-body MS-ring/collar protein FliF [Actinomycetota bacterium]
MDRVRAYGKRFVDGFTPGQKAITALGVVAVVLASMWFMRWASATEYAPLYTDLDPAAAGDVADELDVQGVAYKLENGGRTIMVSRKDVYRMRVDLSAQGLPAGGGDSYALLDEGGITKDEFSKRVDYQRALQGELGRTIEEINGINSASVTLTIPREQVFVGAEEDKATAAVLVDTGSSQLPRETVQSIVHLVSSSIADMDPGSVTVADAAGNMLAMPGQDMGMGAGEQFEQEGAFEAQLEQKLNHLVSLSLGPGRSAVVVDADLDFDKTTTKTTEFQQPNNIEMPVRETTSNETFTGPPSGATGVLGPDGTPIDTGDSGEIDYSKTESDTENALNSVEQEINEAPGSIEKLSVSVMLDSAVVDAGAVQAWEASLSAAAGIDTSATSVRPGDVIEVQRIEFDEEAQEARDAALTEATAAQSSNQMLEMIRYAVTFLIVGLVLFMARGALKKAEANRVPLRVPLDLRELEAGELRLDAASDTAGIAAPARVPIEANNLPVEDEIAGIIDQQPDEVALTLRSWLADRRA